MLNSNLFSSNKVNWIKYNILVGIYTIWIRMRELLSHAIVEKYLKSSIEIQNKLRRIEKDWGNLLENKNKKKQVELNRSNHLFSKNQTIFHTINKQQIFKNQIIQQSQAPEFEEETVNRLRTVIAEVGSLLSDFNNQTQKIKENQMIDKYLKEKQVIKSMTIQQIMELHKIMQICSKRQKLMEELTQKVEIIQNQESDQAIKLAQPLLKKIKDINLKNQQVDKLVQTIKKSKFNQQVQKVLNNFEKPTVNSVPITPQNSFHTTNSKKIVKKKETINKRQSIEDLLPRPRQIRKKTIFRDIQDKGSIKNETNVRIQLNSSKMVIMPFDADSTKKPAHIKQTNDYVSIINLSLKQNENCGLSGFKGGKKQQKEQNSLLDGINSNIFQSIIVQNQSNQQSFHTHDKILAKQPHLKRTEKNISFRDSVKSNIKSITNLKSQASLSSQTNLDSSKNIKSYPNRFQFRKHQFHHSFDKESLKKISLIRNYRSRIFHAKYRQSSKILEEADQNCSILDRDESDEYSDEEIDIQFPNLKENVTSLHHILDGYHRPKAKKGKGKGKATIKMISQEKTSLSHKPINSRKAKITLNCLKNERKFCDFNVQDRKDILLKQFLEKYRQVLREKNFVKKIELIQNALIFLKRNQMINQQIFNQMINKMVNRSKNQQNIQITKSKLTETCFGYPVSQPESLYKQLDKMRLTMAETTKPNLKIDQGNYEYTPYQRHKSDDRFLVFMESLPKRTLTDKERMRLLQQAERIQELIKQMIQMSEKLIQVGLY